MIQGLSVLTKELSGVRYLKLVLGCAMVMGAGFGGGAAGWAETPGLVPQVTVLQPAAAVRQGFLLLTPIGRGLKIDGDLADWPAGAVVTRMPEDAGVVMLADRKGDEDLSATVRAGEDARNLYLGITVRDDVHWAPPEAVAWTNDSIQLGIDPRHQRTPGAYGPHDCEYSLMLGNDGKARVQCWRAPQGVGDQAKAISLAVKRTGHDTVYEVAIPWAALGTAVGASGPVLGLDVLVNDNDGSGRRGYMELTPGIGQSKDPGSYVTALSSGARTAVVMPGKPVAYTDEPVDLRAVVALGTGLERPATVEFAALDKHGRATDLAAATLPAGKAGMVLVKTMLPAGKVPVTTTAVRVRVAEVGGKQIAAGTTPLQVSDIRTRLVAEAARLRARTTEVAGIAQQAEAKGIATDYERVGITVAQDFGDYALDDLAHDRAARAEHVLAVLDQTLTETERTLKGYLAGKASPPLVPRFVTSRAEVKGGAFWADTLVPTTGKRERRPVFFVGYGHYGTVVRDLPKLQALGANIIQIECGPNSTEPEEGVVTDQPVRDFIGGALSQGEKHNVMVCWLASPHYFPAWALAKWPELKRGSGGFFGLAVDAPQAREIWRKHLEVSLKAIGASPALHSVCLSNEPTFTNWQNDPFRRELFTQYLSGKFGAIDKLNGAWGTSYASFAAVPILATDNLPAEADMTPLRYEMARFNMLQFSEYHRFMTDVVHATRPGTWAHAKVMPMAWFDRQALVWGCDPEQFAYAGDLNGNDCLNMFTGFGDQYAARWLPQNWYYDLQRSMRDVPVVNTEDHIIYDREQGLIPPQHTDFALWQGAIHGRGASTIWIWERTYDPKSDFEGSILHRPENVMAVGKVGLDLQRLAPEVVKLQRAKAPVAILYGMTAQIWSDAAYGAMMTAYEALNACGVPVQFVSERQAAAGRLRGFRAVVAPEVKYAPEAAAQAAADYCRAGGKLWVVGKEAPFARDEYNRSRTVSLPSTAIVRFPQESPKELWAAFRAEMQAEGIKPPVTVTDASGRAPWAVEYRATRDKGGMLVSIANLWGTPQRVRLALGDRAVVAMDDLRGGKAIEGDELTLKPLAAMVLRVR